MDRRCLDHTLTEEELRQFREQGFFIVENAIPGHLMDRLIPLIDRVDTEERNRRGAAPTEAITHYNFIGKDDLFLELLDWHTTFPKVWGLMGWNLQLYHTHLTYTPPAPDKSLERDGLGLGWHQDSGQLNRDLETTPRPMVSLKIGFFLSDTSSPGCGNFYVIPGSQKRNDFPGESRNEETEGALPVLAKTGSAVFFDRRLWHSPSTNFSNHPRRVLFYGYSYRWLRPRDDMTVEHYLDRSDPIRQQLLGVSHTGGRGFTSPKPDDVPLKAWIEENVGAEAAGRIV